MHQYRCSNYNVITVTEYQPLNNDVELDRALSPTTYSNILEHSPTVSISSPIRHSAPKVKSKVVTVALQTERA